MTTATLPDDVRELLHEEPKDPLPPLEPDTATQQIWREGFEELGLEVRRWSSQTNRGRRWFATLERDGTYPLCFLASLDDGSWQQVGRHAPDRPFEELAGVIVRSTAARSRVASCTSENPTLPLSAAGSNTPEPSATPPETAAEYSAAETRDQVPTSPKELPDGESQSLNPDALDQRQIGRPGSGQPLDGVRPADDRECPPAPGGARAPEDIPATQGDHGEASAPVTSSPPESAPLEPAWLAECARRGIALEPARPNGSVRGMYRGLELFLLPDRELVQFGTREGAGRTYRHYPLTEALRLADEERDRPPPKPAALPGRANQAATPEPAPRDPDQVAPVVDRPPPEETPRPAGKRYRTTRPIPLFSGVIPAGEVLELLQLHPPHDVVIANERDRRGCAPQLFQVGERGNFITATMRTVSAYPLDQLEELTS